MIGDRNDHQTAAIPLVVVMLGQNVASCSSGTPAQIAKPAAMRMKLKKIDQQVQSCAARRPD